MGCGRGDGCRGRAGSGLGGGRRVGDLRRAGRGFEACRLSASREGVAGAVVDVVEARAAFRIGEGFAFGAPGREAPGRRLRQAPGASGRRKQGGWRGAMTTPSPPEGSNILTGCRRCCARGDPHGARRLASRGNHRVGMKGQAALVEGGPGLDSQGAGHDAEFAEDVALVARPGGNPPGWTRDAGDAKRGRSASSNVRLAFLAGAVVSSAG